MFGTVNATTYLRSCVGSLRNNIWILAWFALLVLFSWLYLPFFVSSVLHDRFDYLGHLTSPVSG